MKLKTRLENLMPNGIPKYIRAYDNGGETADRYTVVYTGRYRGHGYFQYVGMSADPFHPQGFGQHGDAPRQIDVNKWGFAPAMGRQCHLGKRIPLAELPPDCQTLVMRDYRELWALPSPLETLTAKLNPSRFPAMSPKMGSIVAYILGQEWVTPQVNGLVVTSDSFVMAQVKGDCGYNHFIGAESELARNWKELLHVAGLGHDEHSMAKKLYDARVKHS